MAETVVQFTVTRPPRTTTSTTAPDPATVAYERDRPAQGGDPFAALVLGVTLLACAATPWRRRHERSK